MSHFLYLKTYRYPKNELDYKKNGARRNGDAYFHQFIPASELYEKI